MDAPLAAHEFPFPVVACHTDERGDGLAASKKLLKVRCTECSQWEQRSVLAGHACTMRASCMRMLQL